MRLFLIPVHYTQLQVEPGNQSVKFGHDVTIRAIISGRPVTKAELHTRKAGSEEPGPTFRSARTIRKAAPLVGKLEKSLKNCREDMEYRVTAGEVESETYRLTILHPLLLRKIEAAIEPPAYTRKKPSTVKEGDFEVIEGSAVHFRFELDRPAQTAWLRLIPTGKAAERPKPLPLVPMSIDGEDAGGHIGKRDPGHGLRDQRRGRRRHETRSRSGSASRFSPIASRCSTSSSRRWSSKPCRRPR